MDGVDGLFMDDLPVDEEDGMEGLFMDDETMWMVYPWMRRWCGWSIYSIYG